MDFTSLLQSVNWSRISYYRSRIHDNKGHKIIKGVSRSYTRKHDTTVNLIIVLKDHERCQQKLRLEKIRRDIMNVYLGDY